MKNIKNISALFAAIILAFTFTLVSCGDEAVQPKQPDPVPPVVVNPPATGISITADSIVSLLNNRLWKDSTDIRSVFRFNAQLAQGNSQASSSYTTQFNGGQISSERSLFPDDKTFTVLTEYSSSGSATGRKWYLLSVGKKDGLVKMRWKTTSTAGNPDRFLTLQTEL